MSRFLTFATRGLLGMALLAAFGPAATAQEGRQNPQGNENGVGAALLVDGVVREVFLSPRQGQVDVLVQIKVRKAELGAAASGRLFIPAPGEDVYVHTSVASGERRRSVPAERAQVRASLSPRPQGGWQGASPEWFELTSNSPAPASPGDPPPPASPDGPQPGGRPAPKSILEILGIEANPTKVGPGIVLRVAKVTPGGPAEKAGIEPGDVIAAVNDAGITNLDQMAEVVRKGGQVATLTVLNVRDGEATPVKVDLGGALGDARMEPGKTGEAPSAPQPPSEGPSTSNSPRGREQPVPGRSLGLSAEETKIDGVAGLKVTAVKPGSPAQEAGLEIDDFITAADGKGISSPEEMTAAVRRSGPVLTLTVRDHRSGRQVDIQVKLGGGGEQPGPASKPGNRDDQRENRGSPAPAPSRPSPNPNPGAGRSLGIETESTLVGLVPAVKVTRVERGSPADKAGLEVGDVIVSVNDSVIISPDQMDEVVSKASGELTLTVQDVKSGKKTNVKVGLAP